ncbi:MAG: ABC transporter permease [Tsuneonella sp.]
MSETSPKSRLSLLQAAYVVARRDFRAILFSKAFLFFLLGPIFFLGLSVGGGMLGKRAAENAAPPVLAVAMAPADSDAILDARERLAPLIDLPVMEAVAGHTARPAAILGDSGRNYGAVLAGTLSAPRLVGTPELLEKWRGEVALTAANAAGQTQSYPPVALQPTATSGATRRSDRTGTATGALTLLFLLTMLLAGMVMSNLVEEKANKIIEILAAAIPMDAVFLGKLFAMLGVSFVGIGVWGGLALTLIAAGGGNQLAGLTTPAVGWPLFAALFLTYFAMAYLLLGSIFLTIGAMTPTVRDVQTMSMPATMLQLAVFFLATYSTTDLGSPAELFAILFPLSSPYAMVSRAAQEPALWPHVAAIGWQAAWVMLFIRIGSTLFRRRVMKSGPPSPRRRKLFARRHRTPVDTRVGLAR